MMSSTYQRYNLDSSKIISTVTDNATNFEKAFRIYGTASAGIFILKYN